jgi:hypothetical protein
VSDVEEQRNFRRWYCSILCTIDVDGARTPGTVVNLSFNGACVATSVHLPEEGTQLRLDIPHDQGIVSLPATVVHREDNIGVGGRFGLSFDEARERIVGKLMPHFEEYISRE